MSISAVNFAGNRANQYNPEEKKSNSTTKTIASAVLPGLGQICDGRVGAGATFMAGTALCRVGARKLKQSFDKDTFKLAAECPNQILDVMEGKESAKNLKGASKMIFKGTAAKYLGLAGVCLWLASVLDASKKS